MKIKVVLIIEPKVFQYKCDNFYDPFIVFVGQWAKPIEAELSQMIEKEFALPYFEFVYDEHWDLGHGWSGDM